MKTIFFILFNFSVSFILFSQSNSIIEHGLFIDSAVTKLASGFAFTEGPAADKNGNVYFTDQPNNKIFIWTIDNKLDTFLVNSYRANGLYFNNKGDLLACTDLDNTLSTFDLNGNRTIIFDNFENKKVNAPNDAWIDPHGGIYFTDPYYQRPWWERTESELDGEHVYYIEPNSKRTIKVIDDFVKPNGIIGNQNSSIIYVADIGDNKTYSFLINDDGTLTNKKLFCNEGSDGMTIDSKGNVYLTNDAVSIYNLDGELILKLKIPETPANVCFGGVDKNILFITARKSLYSIKMKVAGLK